MRLRSPLFIIVNHDFITIRFSRWNPIIDREGIVDKVIFYIVDDESRVSRLTDGFLAGKVVRAGSESMLEQSER